MPEELEGKVAEDGLTCLRCNVTFSRKDALIRHLKRTKDNGCVSLSSPKGGKSSADGSESDEDEDEEGGGGRGAEQDDDMDQALEDNAGDAPTPAFVPASAPSPSFSVPTPALSTAMPNAFFPPPQQQHGASYPFAPLPPPPLRNYYQPYHGSPMPFYATAAGNSGMSPSAYYPLEPASTTGSPGGWYPYSGPAAGPIPQQRPYESPAPAPMDVLALVAASPANTESVFAATPTATTTHSSSASASASANPPRLDSYKTPLHTYYPEFPPDLLPPPQLIEILVMQFYRPFFGVIHYIISFPLFVMDVHAGTADVGILATILWSCLPVLDPVGPNFNGFTWDWLRSDEYATRLREFCLDWIAKKWEEMKESEDIEQLSALARTLVFGRCNTLAYGFIDLHKEFHLKLAELFPRLKFGGLEGDIGPRPTERLAWIKAEERSRLANFLVMTDIVISESLEIPRRLVPVGGLPLDPKTGSSLVPWTGMRLPAGDKLFDLVNPRGSDVVTTVPADVTLGLGYFWTSLSPEDPARVRALKRLAGGIIDKGGYTGSLVLVTGIWREVQDFVKLCSSRGYLLCSPPETDEQACSARARILKAQRDVWEFYPRALVDLDAQADGHACKAICAEAWGEFRSAFLVHHLVFIHTYQLMMHLPYDLLMTEKYLSGGGSGIGNKTPPRTLLQQNTALEKWPFSDEFVLAEAHAMSVSRLIKSGISNSNPAQVPDVRSLPPIWCACIIRSCWVHVIAIRKLRHILRTTKLAEPSLMDALSAVSGLVEDIEAAVTGLARVGEVWKHNEGALHVVMNVLSKEDDGVWIQLSQEEMAVLRGLNRDARATVDKKIV